MTDRYFNVQEGLKWRCQNHIYLWNLVWFSVTKSSQVFAFWCSSCILQQASEIWPNPGPDRKMWKHYRYHYLTWDRYKSRKIVIPVAVLEKRELFLDACMSSSNDLATSSLWVPPPTCRKISLYCTFPWFAQGIWNRNIQIERKYFLWIMPQYITLRIMSTVTSFYNEKCKNKMSVVILCCNKVQCRQTGVGFKNFPKQLTLSLPIPGRLVLISHIFPCYSFSDICGYCEESFAVCNSCCYINPKGRNLSPLKQQGKNKWLE